MNMTGKKRVNTNGGGGWRPLAARSWQQHGAQPLQKHTEEDAAGARYTINRYRILYLLYIDAGREHTLGGEEKGFVQFI